MARRLRTARWLPPLVCCLLVLGACQSDADVPNAEPDSDRAEDTAPDPTDSSAPGPDPDRRETPPLEPLPPASGLTLEDGSTLLFSEVTGEAGVAVSHRSPFDSKKDGAEMMGGAAVGDFNRDGLEDLFVIGGGVNADSLFINNGDGTFEDRTEDAGLTDRYVGSGATVADYDGDGWLDIYVTSHGTPDEGQVPGRHRLFRNNGDLTFTNVAEDAGVHVTSREESDGFGAAFGDYDLDGDLDLFVSGWVKDSLGNRLFRNEGDGTFEDVTETAGIVDEGIRGFAPCIVDTDGDRYPDIILVADFATTQYFANNRDGTFRKEPSAVPDHGFDGMGVAIGDFNNDGLVDWYATAIFDDDGNGRGNGNRLYINEGDHVFEDAAEEVGVADGGWAWGAVATDLDLNGLLDVVVTNGWRLPSYDNELSKVFLQSEGLTFSEVALETGLHHRQFGLSVLNFDLENDGDQDIAITSGNDAFRLYRNDLESSRTWLRVRLDTSEAPHLAPDGIGSRVWVESSEGRQYRDIASCANYLSTSELVAHFGFPTTVASIDRLVVEWPDGTTTERTDVDPNQTLTISP